MDVNNPVIQLCIEGTRAEFEHRIDAARSLYWKAWESAANPYEACIAAHYVARWQTTPEAMLHWNHIALQCASTADPAQVRDFFPSLYLSLGYSYEQLGNPTEARRYYDLAASLGYPHQP